MDAVDGVAEQEGLEFNATVSFGAVLRAAAREGNLNAGLLLTLLPLIHPKEEEASRS